MTVIVIIVLVNGVFKMKVYIKNSNDEVMVFSSQREAIESMATALSCSYQIGFGEWGS